MLLSVLIKWTTLARTWLYPVGMWVIYHKHTHILLYIPGQKCLVLNLDTIYTEDTYIYIYTEEVPVLPINVHRVWEIYNDPGLYT